jgi:hypothetical protein
MFWHQYSTLLISTLSQLHIAQLLQHWAPNPAPTLLPRQNLWLLSAAATCCCHLLLLLLLLSHHLCLCQVPHNDVCVCKAGCGNGLLVTVLPVDDAGV